MGGPRKGFDVAVLEGNALVGLLARQGRDDVVRVVERAAPLVVGIDSPCACAQPGEKSRPGERALAREVCPIFYTPDEAVVRSGNTFYGWVVEGLELYRSLARSCPAARLVEVFPSAAWTVWAGPRAGRPKAAWSREALAMAGLTGLPARMSQDARDAVGAALVARCEGSGSCLDFDGIRVPRAGAVALKA